MEVFRQLDYKLTNGLIEIFLKLLSRQKMSSSVHEQVLRYRYVPLINMLHNPPFMANKFIKFYTFLYFIADSFSPDQSLWWIFTITIV